MPKLVNFRLIAGSKIRTSLILSFLYSLLFFSPLLKAQYWTNAQVIGSAAKEAAEALASDSEGNLYLSGTYGDQLTIGERELASQGLDDVFLVKYQNDGRVDWVVDGGGTSFDQVSAVEVDANDDIIWGGQFWVEGIFGDLNLPLEIDSRGIYLIKYDNAGDLLWGRTIEGTGIKELTDIDSDPDGNLYLTGYFAETLIVDDTILQVEGVQNLFLLKLNPQGELLWARTAGYAGELWPQGVEVNAQGLVVVAGDFLGKAVFQNDSIQTNTIDRDVFIAAYDTEGQTLWGRKAGGVYEDNCRALVLDETGRSYLTGMFLGVMRLSDDLEITTEGFNENFFLTGYRADGTPWLARSLGSTDDESGNDLLLHENQLLLTGHYFGNLEIDGESIAGDVDHFNGFLAAFDLEGNLDWLRAAKSSQYLEGNHLAGAGQSIFLAGNFATDARFDNRTYTGFGINDIFLAQFDPLSTSTSAPILDLAALAVFPNPTNGPVNLQWELPSGESAQHLQLININGQIVQSWPLMAEEQTRSWSVDALPAGMYWWQLVGEQGLVGRQKMIVLKN